MPRNTQSSARGIGNIPGIGSVREVVREAEAILKEVRGRALYLVPFRLIRHLPEHDSLIRPVDTLRATFIGTGISTSGFRRHEPCCTNDPIPEIGLPRYVIGGNHRCASTRDSGQVLVPTNRVSVKQVRRLMRLLTKEDQLLINSGLMRSHFAEKDQAMRCMEILAVTLQGMEPAPKALTCLQQVQLIRTAARNDPTLNFVHSGSLPKGGVGLMRSRVFPGHAGTDDSSIHFLLNNNMGDRNKNKLLKGAVVLISTESSFKLPAIPDRKSLLDILVFWESKDYIGAFLDTHLAYAGAMSTTILHTITEHTLACIENGDYNTTPFNTAAYRLHVGGCTSKRRTSDSPKKSGRPSKKRKTALPVSKKKTDTDNDPQHSSPNESSPIRVGKSSKAVKEPPSTDAPVRESRKTKFTPKAPESQPESEDASEGVEKRVSGDEKPSVPPQKATEVEEKDNNGAVREALERERALLEKKHKQEMASAVKIAKESTKSKNGAAMREIEKLQKELSDLRNERDAELKRVKAEFEVQKKEEESQRLKEFEAQNGELRRKLKDFESQQAAAEQKHLSELQQLREENETMRKELESAASSSHTVRRTGRAVIPTDRMIANMSSAARKELRRRIDACEREQNKS